MAVESSQTAGEDEDAIEVDALVAFDPQEFPMARRLGEELGKHGLHTYFPAPGRLGQDLDEIRGRQPQLPALVVLWTPDSDGSVVERRVVEFEDRLALAGDRAPIIPIFLGGTAGVSAPADLRRHVGPVVDSEIHERGLDGGVSAEARASWGWAVGRIAEDVLVYRRRLSGDGAGSTEDRSAPEPKDSPQGVSGESLHPRRVLLPGGQAGWLLAEDLAVVRTTERLPRELDVEAAPAGLVFGARVRRPPADSRLANYAFLEITPRPQLPWLAAAETPEASLEVELWDVDLSRTAQGILGERNADGSFDIEFPEPSAPTRGSGVWSVAEGRFLGIAEYDKDRGRIVLLPVSLLRELAAESADDNPPPPSARVHDDSWTIEDHLDYTLYARAIKEFIQHPDTRPPLVIGVQGPWGQGKTSLMRLAQDRLDPEHPDLVKHREATEAPPEGPSEVTFKDLRESLDGDVDLDEEQPAEARTVWFNPWKYQSSEALWAGLANAILSQLPARLSRRKQELFWLQLQARRIDAAAVRRDIHRFVFDRLLPGLAASVLVGMVVAIVCVAVGLSAAFTALGSLALTLGGALVSWAFAHHKALNRKLEGNYLRYVSQPDYSGKLGYFHYVEEDMRRALDLLAPADEPTVIFIDDLDRCGATRIGEVLEAINLFLSGEYPNCFFVLGIDAEVVASAMEALHKEALGRTGSGEEKSGDRLGWRFLDKFIQLSFVMPRISDESRGVYLEMLLGVEGEGTNGDGRSEAAALEAEQVLRQVVDQDLAPAAASAELGELKASTPVAETAAVRQIAEEVIARGARDFRDTDPETVKALKANVDYLSDNPRTIKRAVNLYRFYRFISWARKASGPDLEAADADLIASWTVIAARWPEAVHWLQVHGRDDKDARARLLAEMKDEPQLKVFLEKEKDLDLNRAMECGLW